MKEGWVKLFRKSMEWEWYTDIPTCHLWNHILLMANIEPSSYRGVEIPRGSFGTTEERLAIETGLSRQQIRTALRKLISTNEITKVSNKNMTIISVNKYDDYQLSMDDINQQITTGATNTLMNKKKRREEYNNKPPISPFKIPTVGEVREYCESRRNSVDPEEFVDFYTSKGWMVGKSRMKDWKASVRTWERSGKKSREDSLPTYDPSKNRKLSSSELDELLSLKGKK